MRARRAPPARRVEASAAARLEGRVRPSPATAGRVDCDGCHRGEGGSVACHRGEGGCVADPSLATAGMTAASLGQDGGDSGWIRVPRLGF
uniref:DUF834 domain-containing protein n=1 Tax=Oryza punctata TaxID=4537 RepID=A0A0E0LVJ1_ORYPU